MNTADLVYVYESSLVDGLRSFGDQKAKGWGSMQEHTQAEDRMRSKSTNWSNLRYHTIMLPFSTYNSNEFG